MRRQRLFISLSIFTRLSLVFADCECGYRIRGTDEYYASTDLTSFANFPDSTNLNKNPSFAQNWTVQSWSRPASETSPLNLTWGEDNVWIENGTLVLRQQGYSSEDAASGRNVSGAAIVSTRSDFLHMSARAVFSVDAGSGDTRGSVAGFFWYHNDSSEIDIEVLTKDPGNDTVHYTTQPSISSQNGSIIPDAVFTAPLGNILWTDLQSYRFDWTSKNVSFFQNSNLRHSTTTNIPKDSGTIQLNLWATNSSWSGYPSRDNVTMRVKSIQFFYNTTESDSGKTPLCTKNGTILGTAGEDPNRKGTMCYDDGSVVAMKAWGNRLGPQGISWLLTVLAVVFYTL